VETMEDTNCERVPYEGRGIRRRNGNTEPPVVLVEDGLSPTQLPAQVLGLGTNYLSYVISFLVLAVYWQAHHRVFRPIRG
jgi:hypothetical protein